ncbi:MAG: F0F1 ATP synthase subunit gamma [Rickettsiales bacterium]|nr:F0F1 ATP synthase subunit gamma [Rickettsiales bacterium]
MDSLKNDLRAAKELQNVISTMKVVAATNIKKYEKVAAGLSKYRDNVDFGLQAILQQSPNVMKYIDYSEKNYDSNGKRNMVIVVGSNQGLCGRFNDKIVDFYLENGAKDDDFVVVVGDRIEGILKSKKVHVDKKFSTPNSTNLIFKLVHDLCYAMELMKGDVGKIVAYFMSHGTKNSGNLTKKKIFPLDRSYFEKLKNKPWPTNNIPFWRVETRVLAADLVQQYIFCSIYLTISNSMAAEQWNRLITLQGAEENIKDHITVTTLQYNQTRQNAITSELIDVVSGARFLRKKI